MGGVGRVGGKRARMKVEGGCVHMKCGGNGVVQRVGRVAVQLGVGEEEGGGGGGTSKGEV